MGGRFIRNLYNLQINAVKDKDVICDVRETGCIGFVGSDVADEVRTEGVLCTPLEPIGALRYALLSRPAVANRTEAKWRFKLPLRIGTSYPVQARAMLGPEAEVAIVRSGSVEGLPWRFRELDAVFELVSSGKSSEENNLAIAVDNIAPVNLVLVTPLDGEEPRD